MNHGSGGPGGPGVVVGTIKPEAERAEEFKTRLREAFGPVLEIMEEARRDGLLTEFQLQPDAYGRYSVQSLSMVRRY